MIFFVTVLPCSFPPPPPPFLLLQDSKCRGNLVLKKSSTMMMTLENSTSLISAEVLHLQYSHLPTFLNLQPGECHNQPTRLSIHKWSVKKTWTNLKIGHAYIQYILTVRDLCKREEEFHWISQWKILWRRNSPKLALRWEFNQYSKYMQSSNDANNVAK